MKIGAFVSTTTGLVMDNLSSVIDEWIIFTEKMTIDEMLAQVQKAAAQMIEDIKPFIDDLKWLLGLAKEVILVTVKIVKTGDGMARWIQSNILDPVANAGVAIVESGADVYDWATGVETIGNNANNAANAVNNLAGAFDIAAQNAQNLVDTDTGFSGAGGSFGAEDINDMMQPASNGGGTWLTALEEEAQIAAMELEDFDRQWQKLHDEKPILLELPRWQKFLDENLSPLQTYQNEIEKLNMLMADGSEQGFQAFAIGSAGALAKLKSSMGVSAEPKFASAITKGSAEDFKATIDMQSKTKDVQQEIKELMALANQMQAEQLAEQKKIAAAILAQRPAQVLAFCGPV